MNLCVLDLMFLRSEAAASYLLSWVDDINPVDSESVTPLHLAVRSGLANGSTRLVRHLLLKGADRNVTDKDGRTPADLIRSQMSTATSTTKVDYNEFIKIMVNIYLLHIFIIYDLERSKILLLFNDKNTFEEVTQIAKHCCFLPCSVFVMPLFCYLLYSAK
jgi:hypothetical protein